MEKGIIKCGLKIGETYDRDISKNDVVFMESGKTYTFFLEPLQRFFSPDTTNLKNKVDTAKWAYILRSFFEIALKKNNEIYSEWGYFKEWAIGDAPKENISHLGIGNQYKEGDHILFKFNNESGKINSWIGNSYRIEVFNKIPNMGLNFYLVPYRDKHIRFAYFVDRTDSPKKTAVRSDSLEFFKQDFVYMYGDTFTLVICLHRFVKSKLDLQDIYQDFELELYLCDGVTGKSLSDNPILKKPLSQYKEYLRYSNTGTLNSDIEIILPISENWKDDYHTEKETKKYSVEVRIVSTIANDNGKRDQYSFNIIQKDFKVYGSDGETEHAVVYKTKNFFTVKKSAFDISHFMENEKKNMIQYIGDVEYNYREYDPCGYSAIKVKELDNKERTTAFTIFEEGEKFVTDQTKKTYDIIAGDDKEKPKKVEIEVVDLKNTDVQCQGILLPEGEEHSEIRNVFQTDFIHSARERILFKKELEKIENKNEEPPVKQDNTRVEIKKLPEPNLTKENYKLFPVTEDRDNYKGQDVAYKPDPTQEGDYDMEAKSSYNISDVQALKEGTHYTIKDHKFTFTKLNYVYYKKITDAPPVSQTYSTTEGLIDNTIDSFWMFNYFWLSEDLAQTYFLPISTCRYPNQIAQIRVFPNIKWKISFLFSDKKTPQSFASTGMPADEKRTSGNTSYHPKNEQVSIYEEQVNKAKKATQKRKQGATSYDFDLIVSYNINGHSIEAQKGIAEKVQNFVTIFKNIKETVDKLCHNDEKHAQNLIGKLPKSKGIPLYIKFDYPTIRIDGSWEFASQLPPYQNEVQPAGEISLGFEPLIRGEGGIDLIALSLMSGKTVPVVGQILVALEFVEMGVQVLADLNGYEISRKLELNVYAFSQIDARVKIPIHKKDHVNMQVDGRLGIGVQFKAEAGVIKKGINFQSDSNDVEGGFGLAFEAKGESYLELLASAGFEKEKGFFVEPKINFGGVKVTIIAKTIGKGNQSSSGNSGKALLNKPIWIVDKKDDIIQLQRFYPFS